MAGRMAEGFEQYPTGTQGEIQMGQGLWVVSGAGQARVDPQTTPVAGAWSTKSLQVKNGIGFAAWTDGNTFVTAILKFRIWITEAPATTQPLIRFFDGTDTQTQCGIFLNPMKQLVFGRGCASQDNLTSGNCGGPTTVLTTGTTILSTSVWYHVECKVTINNTTGAYELRLQGSPTAEFAVTGADTQVTSNASFTHMILNCGAQGADVFYDDVALSDSTGGINDGFDGDCGVQTMMPNGEVTGNWTPLSGTDNSLMVDEFSTGPDDDTTYNSAATNVADLYDMEPLYANAASVQWIQPMARLKKTDTGANQCRINTKSGATTHNGGTINPGTTYGYFQKIHDTDPNTSAAWTLSAMGTIQLGIERTL